LQRISLEQRILSFYGNVTFTGNLGGAIYATNSTIHFQQSFKIKFVKNLGKEGGAIALYNNSQMIVGEQTSVTFIGNHADKDGGAILADGSTIVLKIKGVMSFIDNEGYDGGAVALRNGASIVLNFKCEFVFARNHAQSYGGALHVTDAITTWFKPDLHDPTKNSKQCFFKFNLTQVLYLEEGIPRMVFVNNTAGYAGSALYGGWVDLCQIRGYHGIIGANVFRSIFHFEEALHDLSTVSSNPTRVCVCINGLPACSTIKHNITAYPGETFQIPAVAVGQWFGTVPFTVHARVIPINSSNSTQMKSMQGTQVVGKNCTNLSFTILSGNRFEDVILTVDKFNVPEWTYLNFIQDMFPIFKKSILLKHSDLHVHILMRPCPLGFLLFNSSCICHPYL